MGRLVLFAALLLAGLPLAADPVPPLPPVDLAHLPWTDGETLTYHISWETLDAAQGTFTASRRGDHWQFSLALASEGLVNHIYPFTSSFWSLLAGSFPWRSFEYGEYRFEPKRTIKERTRIDYAERQGRRENWVKGETKTFPVDRDGIDDVGTMLYHVRAVPWSPGDKRTIYVYESSSEKQAEATCLGRETRAFGAWPAQPVLEISLLPTIGTHRRGHLTMWMTDDARRIPLHAEIDFLYGSFAIDLIRAVTPAPGVPAGK